MHIIKNNVIHLYQQKQTVMINRAKNQRKFKAMQNKAFQLGFTSVLDAENAGFGEELKKAFDNEK